jgi:hypothetical protein
MGKFSDKSCRVNQNTFYVRQLFPKNRAFCEITWKNAYDDIIRDMRFEYWINKAADTLRMQQLLLFEGKSGYANTPQSYVYKYITALLFVCDVN